MLFKYGLKHHFSSNQVELNGLDGSRLFPSVSKGEDSVIAFILNSRGKDLHLSPSTSVCISVCFAFL